MFAQKQAEAAGADWREFVIEALIRVLGFSTIGFVLLIFLFLLREGVPSFYKVPLSNLFGINWYPTFGLFGTLPLLLGSVLVTVTAILMAMPLGVATAVFVREVAPNWAREILKPMIEVLAGIPSVVLGFFGMSVVAPLIRETLGDSHGPYGVHRRPAPGLHGASHHHQRGRRRFGCDPEKLQRCWPGHGGDAMADDLASGCASSPFRNHDSGDVGHGACHR